MYGTRRHLCDLPRNEFIIVDSQETVSWTRANGRKFCQNVLGTDYFSINSLQRQVEVMKVAYKHGIEAMAWIGLTGKLEEGAWKWVDKSPTHNFFFWQNDDLPPVDVRRNHARIRFDEFGSGWRHSKGTKTNEVLICTHPSPTEGSQGGLSSCRRLADTSKICANRGKCLKLKSRRQNRQYFLVSTLASTAKKILVVT